MKEVKAFIKPKRVQEVFKASRNAHFESVTLSKKEGTGAHLQKDASPSFEFHFTDCPVVKLELVCHNDETDQVVRLISTNARTPETGDGIIYITEVNDAFRIKTGKSLKRYDL